MKRNKSAKFQAKIKRQMISDYRYELSLHKATLANGKFWQVEKIDFAMERIELIKSELARLDNGSLYL